MTTLVNQKSTNFENDLYNKIFLESKKESESEIESFENDNEIIEGNKNDCISIINDGLYCLCGNCKTPVPLWQQYCPACHKKLNWKGYLYE